ncbi:MAG: insulinase family protein [Planctomycetes bacterium]|nr:insulinase family protein [Planctomycetota bacterium]
MTRRCSVALLALSLSTTGCWFSQAQSNELIDRPTNVAREPEQPIDETRPENDLTTSGGHTLVPVVGGLAPIEEVALPKPLISGTKEGLTVATLQTEGPLAGLVTHTQLTIPHRNLLGDRDGIASLSARTILEAARPESSQPSLRTVIEDLGGRIEVDVDRTVTRFTLSVRHDEWKGAIRELFDAIQRRPTRAQVLAARQLQLHDLADVVRAAPTKANFRRVTNSFDPTKPLLSALQDLDPLRVGVFLDRAYRPASATLTVVGRDSPTSLAHEAKLAAQSWLQRFEPQTATPTVPTPLPSTIYWATDDSNVSTLTSVFEVPAAIGPHLTGYSLAMECLVGNGSSGRIGETIEERFGTGVRPNVEWVSNGSTQSILVHLTVPSVRIPEAIEAIEDGLQSSVQRAFTKTEVRDAAERMRLRTLREWGTPRLAAEALSRYVLTMPMLQPEVVEGAVKQIRYTVRTLDLDDALAVVAQRPPLHIVAGGQAAESLGKLVTAIGEFETNADAAFSTKPEEAQRVGAEIYLTGAFEAVGGKERLLAMTGYVSKSVTRTGRGPGAGEATLFDIATGKFRRKRTVLATTIDTYISGDEALEFVDDKNVVELDPAETAQILEDARRHPLLLLADAARGAASYRLVSQRPVDDRYFAILERNTDGATSLRIHIDTESFLVRKIESVQHRPGIGTINLTETFRDYRNVDGLRIPHIRTTTLDDTNVGTTTLWLEFLPTAPPPQAFEFGVPGKTVPPIVPPTPPGEPARGGR